MSSASSGIQRNLESFAAAAHRIADRPFSSESVRDIVDLKQAKHGVSANALVIRVADEMTGTLIDLLA